MNSPFQPFIDEQGFAMLDGGLATELERHGADLDHYLWSARVLAEAPERISRVHDDYLAAGADVIATATYQASFEGFARAGLGRAQAGELMKLSVRLARDAVDRFWSESPGRTGRLRPLVAASLGPYGACLHDGSEYHGNYGLDHAALVDFHRPRVEALAHAGADLLAFETIPSLLEAEALVTLLEDYPDHPAWISFSCRDGQHISHGESFASCVSLLDQAASIVAIGINCTAPGLLLDLFDCLGSTGKPLMAYPNSGETWQAESNCWVGRVDSGHEVLDWYRAGVRIFGGCCRTGPAYIRNIRNRLHEHLA